MDAGALPVTFLTAAAAGSSSAGGGAGGEAVAATVGATSAAVAQTAASAGAAGASAAGSNAISVSRLFSLASYGAVSPLDAQTTGAPQRKVGNRKTRAYYFHG